MSLPQLRRVTALATTERFNVSRLSDTAPVAKTTLKSFFRVVAYSAIHSSDQNSTSLEQRFFSRCGLACQAWVKEGIVNSF
jgi:hypothetical protein